MSHLRPFKPTILQVWVAATMIFALSYRLGGQVIERGDFHHPADGMVGEERCQKSIEVGPGISLPVVIDVTSKGNGWMKIANLQLRVFKEHDDGDVFDPPLLRVEFVDITGDGYKDLVIVGILKHTGEKETDAVTLEPIASIYAFDPKTNQFRLRFRCGPSLEDKAN